MSPDTRTRFRAALKFLKPKKLSECRLVKDSVVELLLAINDHAWGTAPASAKDRKNLEVFRAALVKLRTAGRQLPIQLAYEVLPPDLDKYIGAADYAIKSHRRTTDQKDTFAKMRAAVYASEILGRLGRPEKTTVRSDWCQLAAILHYGDKAKHGEMRHSCVAVLKRRKREVVQY